MKIFTQSEIIEAQAYAASGGQALHLHRIIVDYDKAPNCFVRAIENGEDIAHLFDHNFKRLIMTARSLGVNVICVEHIGNPGQHIDLCSLPLKKAIKMCQKYKDENLLNGFNQK